MEIVPLAKAIAIGLGAIGPAIGIGASMTLAMDARFAAPNATFGSPPSSWWTATTTS